MCVGFANICRCFMNYHVLPATPFSCPSMKTTLKNSIPNLFKESSRYNSLRSLWPTGNPGLALPPSLVLCAFVALKQGNCTLITHWTLQIISGTARGSPTIGTQWKFGGGKWLHSSRLSSACSLKITPFWWGSLDLLRSVLLSNLRIKISSQWESSSCLKSSGTELSKQSYTDFHNKREGDRSTIVKKKLFKSSISSGIHRWDQMQTYTCIRSLSVWGCSCLTWGVTIAGWGMPVVWGPGGPGIMWWENLKEGKRRKIHTTGCCSKT